MNARVMKNEVCVKHSRVMSPSVGTFRRTYLKTQKNCMHAYVCWR